MNATEIGLYNKLKGTAALTATLSTTTAIYNAVAPAGTSMAYVVFVYAGGGLENITPSELHNVVYMVKAVADDSAEAATIQGHIKTALHGQTLKVGGYTNFYTACEDEISYVEQTREGALIHHRGYYVRVRVDD